jgi:hypothetical protein
MATFYCTGPAFVFVQFNSAGNVFHVGTDEGNPGLVIKITEAVEPVFNDIGGTQLPTEYQHQGESATILTTLTRWNESVIARMMARPQHVARPAVGALGDIGRLYNSEGYANRLWVQFPFANKAAFGGAMPAAYRFFSVTLRDSEILPGTKAKKHRCVFEAYRVLSFTNGSPTMALYDHDVQGLPNPD